MNEVMQKGYQQAGAEFLAWRLQRVFARIDNAEDQALHNDLVRDISEIIKGKEHSFLKTLAEDMIYIKVNRRKRFLVRLAGRILNYGMRK